MQSADHVSYVSLSDIRILLGTLCELLPEEQESQQEETLSVPVNGIHSCLTEAFRIGACCSILVPACLITFKGAGKPRPGPALCLDRTWELTWQAIIAALVSSAQTWPPFLLNAHRPASTPLRPPSTSSAVLRSVSLLELVPCFEMLSLELLLLSASSSAGNKRRILQRLLQSCTMEDFKEALRRGSSLLQRQTLLRQTSPRVKHGWVPHLPPAVRCAS
ncbi:unnamed protein product [Pleuronectes platessa]|uniref:Uncharacterized protein n=1 Tax=Pleuronectes platessa TaxID=8262 RepID=A0A9N7ZAJ4_PLEPL|nr:unnamed protein product [Pleuronectes platessa]